MKCKPGDMAVVMDAFHKTNVGTFVNIVELYDTKDSMNLARSQPVWLVASYAPLTWTRGQRLWHGNRGPVPDAAVHPIRDRPTGSFQSTSTAIKND